MISNFSALQAVYLNYLQLDQDFIYVKPKNWMSEL